TNFATGETSTLLNLAVGKLLAKVEPLTGNSSFSVRTPSAISGVRGTSFEVEIEEPSRKFPF
ncbi:MAG TPA: FecR domain-containing protein, partial [Candidatus Omnitrophota bacterium]|nr:FecR domain-containing protein [Candidatus Omnitrophota bacterium]